MHSPEQALKKNQKKNKLLLHVCCGPCATVVIETLAKDYALTLYFSNDNLFPEAEYLRRQQAVLELAQRLDITVIADSYCHQDWLLAVAGLEKEPERGGRCIQCFGHRLRHTVEKAKQLGIHYFSTTLPISPYKDYQQICAIGEQLAKDNSLQFIVQDFSQNGGYKRSILLSKEYGLYRQKYCGCEFSLYSR